MQQQWVTVSEASHLLDVTERTIQRYIRENKYPSQLKNGRRYILLDLSEDVINGLKDLGNVVTEKEDVTTDLMKDKLIDKMESEIEYLREELSKTREELDQSRQRSDTIILQLTRQFEQQTVLLEDMHNKSSFWRRLKMGLVRFATPSATEQRN